MKDVLDRFNNLTYNKRWNTTHSSHFNLWRGMQMRHGNRWARLLAAVCAMALFFVGDFAGAGGEVSL